MGSNRQHEMGLGDAHHATQKEFHSPLRMNHLEMHDIIKVAAGGFSAAITSSHSIILWGTGEFGCFIYPQKVCIEGISFRDIQISNHESKSFIAAIDTKGLLYTWGTNEFGQLGHGDHESRSLPHQVLQLRKK